MAAAVGGRYADLDLEVFFFEVALVDRGVDSGVVGVRGRPVKLDRHLFYIWF